MNPKLMRSVVSLVAILGLGTGVSFALFTSNTVSITSNSLTTGMAEIKLCNASAGDTWTDSVTGFSLGNLVPGGAELEMTSGTDLRIGNDSGNLDNNIAPDCTNYSGTPGSSDVNLDLVPLVTALSCADSDPDTLDNHLELKFIVGANDSGFLSLEDWQTNTTSLVTNMAPDTQASVQMFARLDDAATDQNANCTFTTTFTGSQSI